MRNILKYYTCYLTERLHRYVFDNCYIQDHEITFIDQTCINRFNALYNLNPDYREYLNWWHEIKGKDYIRYKKYTEVPINLQK